MGKRGLAKLDFDGRVEVNRRDRRDEQDGFLFAPGLGFAGVARLSLRFVAEPVQEMNSYFHDSFATGVN